MDNGYIFALLGAVGFGTTDFLTGLIAKKFDGATFYFWSAILRLLLSGVVLWYVSGSFVIEPFSFLVLIFVGVLYYIANRVLLASMPINGVGITTIFANINPIYVFVLSALFLGESFSFSSLAAITIAVAGVCLIYIQDISSIHIKHIGLAIIPGLFWAFTYVLQEPLFTQYNAYSLSFWYFAVWIPCTLVELKYSQKKPHMLSWKQTALLLFHALVYVGAAIISTLAFERGDSVSIVSAILIFSIVVTLLLSRIFYKETYSVSQIVGIGFTIFSLVYLVLQ